jgi:hypothetical protein
VRVIQRSGVAALAAAAVLIATASGASRPLDSGVRGVVLYGPTCPVQRPGRSCVKPYAASISIRREPAGTLIVRAHSAADGRFSVRLRAGRYLLQPRNGRPFPRAHSQTISVRRHRFTAVTIRFDSGIR